MIPQTRHLDLNRHTALESGEALTGPRAALGIGSFSVSNAEGVGPRADFPGLLPGGVCVVG